MALGYLFLVFIVIVLIGLVGGAVLLLSRNETLKKAAFYLLAILGIIVGYMGATSQPTNFVGWQIYCWAMSILAMAAVVVRLVVKIDKAEAIANVMVIASVIGGVAKLFF